MEKERLRTEHVQTEGLPALTLDYYLLTQPGALADSYGVEIVLRQDGHTEAASAADITPIGSKILTIIDRLADGTVTPVGLQDVLEELLA